MSSLSLFMIEVLMCFFISIFTIYLLRPLLREILVDLCGTRTRAEFWLMFTQLMLIISPLLLVIYFAPTRDFVDINMVEVVKNTLFRSLLGDFIALMAIGHIIWKSIGNEAKEIRLTRHIDSNPNETVQR